MLLPPTIPLTNPTISPGRPDVDPFNAELTPLYNALKIPFFSPNLLFDCPSLASDILFLSKEFSPIPAKIPVPIDFNSSDCNMFPILFEWSTAPWPRMALSFPSIFPSKYILETL